MSTVDETDFRMIVPYGNERIPFDVHRCARRTRRSVAIHVDPDGRVRVDVPPGTGRPAIRQAVMRRLGWVHRQLVDIEARRRQVTPRHYVSGETVLYLGRRYRLKVLNDSDVPSTALRGGYLELRTPDRSADVVRTELERWLRTRARAVLPERLLVVSKHLRWVKDLPKLSIRRMTRQWGSCSPSGRIALNVDLIRAPTQCIDYVILHELCHLKVHNHGRAFYRLLDAQMPGWQGVKARLDNMAEQLLNR